MTGGSARLRARDLARLGELVRNRGAQVLPASWIDACLTEHEVAGPDRGYGYLFWHERFAGHDAWLMSGNGGNKVIVLDPLEAVIVVTATNYGRRGCTSRAARSSSAT
jgi:CubicO group peptidase (beta-lactamase class C family)